MDNLNTHSVASLYQAFAPDLARRLVNRLCGLSTLAFDA
jgi:hypothetical protein